MLANSALLTSSWRAQRGEKPCAARVGAFNGDARQVRRVGVTLQRCLHCGLLGPELLVGEGEALQAPQLPRPFQWPFEHHTQLDVADSGVVGGAGLTQQRVKHIVRRGAPKNAYAGYCPCAVDA
jgi:hypothetical protein